MHKSIKKKRKYSPRDDILGYEQMAIPPSLINVMNKKINLIASLFEGRTNSPFRELAYSNSLLGRGL